MVHGRQAKKTASDFFQNEGFPFWLKGRQKSNCYSPASEASRQVANLTERKNPHTPIYGDKEFVCLWSTLTPIVLGLVKQNGPKKILGHLWQKAMSQIFLFVRKVAGRAEKATFWPYILAVWQGIELKFQK